MVDGLGAYSAAAEQNIKSWDSHLSFLCTLTTVVGECNMRIAEGMNRVKKKARLQSRRVEKLGEALNLG